MGFYVDLDIFIELQVQTYHNAHATNFNYIIGLDSEGTWIKCHFSNCTLGWVQHCIKNWILNLKRIRRWRISGCRGLIDILSIRLITWRSSISIFLIHYINLIKHVHLIDTRWSILVVGMTCVAPLQRGSILCNHRLVLNHLGYTLNTFSDILMMRKYFM